MISIKSTREIEIMMRSCQLAAQTLRYIEEFIKAGVSTEELNTLCHDFILSHGAKPSPLNYHGFPKSICTSVNEVICHGIPSPQVILKDGDIINVDVTTYLEGFHGDTNKTFFVGNVKQEVRDLVGVTYECLKMGIAQVRPGARLGDIGHVIQTFAEGEGYSVVQEYCGHGIGREFHEEPQVLHYGARGTGVELKQGMTFTIEPMINLGKRFCRLKPDKWTVVTTDGKPSAQFEHTILVTKDGYQVMTLLPGESL